MSKRARITLNQDPDTGSEIHEDTEAVSETEAEFEDATDIDSPSVGSSDHVASTPARVLNPGFIVKTVVVGLAVAALVLFWKRRPM